MRSPVPVFVAAAILAASSTACYRMLPNRGGGPTDIPPAGPVAKTGARPVDARDLALPEGYSAEVVATGLTFPTSITFDDRGGIYVTEAGYAYGEKFLEPRLLEIRPDGTTRTVFAGENPPWNSVTWHDGAFLLSEGGQVKGGRIVRVTPDGERTVLVQDLPSLGDHHTDSVVVGKDGWIYFSQGTATNSAVVGVDNYDFGWLKRFPDFHDRPCEDVTLTGENFTSKNPLTEDPDDEAVTGAYKPFNVASRKGEVIPGVVPCNGAVMRVRPEGGPVELVAWGFRNPFGLSFGPDGSLWVTDNGYDMRGSRPVFGAADWLWKVEPGRWYGWPDFAGGRNLDDERFEVLNKPRPPRLLAKHRDTPRPAAAFFGVHSSSNGFDFSRNPAFGHVGQAFVAQFGDMSPDTGRVYGPVGFKIVRVDPATGVIEPFATNRKGSGPASKLETGGIERPVSARFDPSGTSLYVVDFGVMDMREDGPLPVERTGVVWRITRAPVASRVAGEAR